MKRFTTLLAAAAFTLLVPTVAGAQAPYVYRPELRAWVFVPKPAPGVFEARTPAENIARHEAMANGYRGTTHGASGRALRSDGQGSARGAASSVLTAQGPARARRPVTHLSTKLKHQLLHGGAHQFRLVQLHPMRAAGGDDVPARV